MTQWFSVGSGGWIDLGKVVYARRAEATDGQPAGMAVWYAIGADHIVIEGEAADRLASRLDMLAAAASREANGIKD